MNVGPAHPRPLPRPAARPVQPRAVLATAQPSPPPGPVDDLLARATRWLDGLLARPKPAVQPPTPAAQPPKPAVQPPPAPVAPPTPPPDPPAPAPTPQAPGLGALAVLTPYAPRDGMDRYRVQVGRNAFHLELPAGADVHALLDVALGPYLALPQPLRTALKALHVNEGPSPWDADFQRKHGDPGWRARATAEGGRIDFWGGLAAFGADAMKHELGHAVGNELGRGLGHAPGWDAAVASDGAHVSAYAATNLQEDFASTWEVYLDAREAGDEALAAFRARYPARAAILAGIFGDPIP